MQKSTKVLLIIVYSLFLVVSFGLPFFSFEGYSILSNTTSHLAAQSSPFAWVMDLIFICLGVASILINYKTGVVYHQVFGCIFGFSLIMTAFFPHAPLVTNVLPNLFFDKMHSIFASITGFSFTMLAFGHGIVSREKQRFWGFVMATIAILVSMGMMMFPSFMGILQRIMFMSAFGWLFFYMRTP
ncbi:MAG: DUF998 domain-containing protein [Sphaerochaetaceae bacterium]|nr:DUF998 domain-containing protein [Sphaerochaetaceae bacterium]MDC7250572.1 DUF998 domain-containing protein [Sphaerochaetaceae bacterium]